MSCKSCGNENKKITDKVLDNLISEILYARHGNKCQICGKIRTDCATMHILSKGSSPELRWELYNVLWACWEICHGPSHSGKDISDRIVILKGKDYKNNLYELSQMNRTGKLDRDAIKKHLIEVLHAESKD